MIARAKSQLLHLAALAKDRKFAKLRFELFVKPRPSSLIKLFRYLFVGATAYIVDFSILVALVSGLGINYLIAATISFTFGVTVSYFMARRWVFAESRYKKHTEMLGVLLIGVIGLILNNILLALFTEWLGLFYIYSKLIATVFVFFWNFFARHVFLRPPKDSSL